jgi:hypothetical protein
MTIKLLFNFSSILCGICMIYLYVIMCFMPHQILINEYCHGSYCEYYRTSGIAINKIQILNESLNNYKLIKTMKYEKNKFCNITYESDTYFNINKYATNDDYFYVSRKKKSNCLNKYNNIYSDITIKITKICAYILLFYGLIIATGIFYLNKIFHEHLLNYYKTLNGLVYDEILNKADLNKHLFTTSKIFITISIVVLIVFNN